MNPKRKKSFNKMVLAIVRRIPRGKVLTYGQVAAIAGVPRGARIVGGVLFHSGIEAQVPWQRVINAQGKISTYRVGMGEEQRRLLQAEGLKFNRMGAVELKKHQWRPPLSLLHKYEVDEETVWRLHHGTC